MSSAYRSLHINTSRERMEYSDYPMPASYPDFPHHSQIARYFDDYVNHFGFRHKIIFETGVDRAARDSEGVWTVRLDTGETFEVLKNFPTEAELRAAVAPFAAGIDVRLFQYYWALLYETQSK